MEGGSRATDSRVRKDGEITVIIIIIIIIIICALFQVEL